MKKEYTIKYLPTGHTFLLPKDECDRLIIESEHNYKVLDKEYIMPEREAPKAQSTVYESIIEKKPKSIDKMNLKELSEYCEKNNLTVEPEMKKADIVALIKGKQE